MNAREKKSFLYSLILHGLILWALTLWQWPLPTVTLNLSQVEILHSPLSRTDTGIRSSGAERPSFQQTRKPSSSSDRRSIRSPMERQRSPLPSTSRDKMNSLPSEDISTPLSHSPNSINPRRHLRGLEKIDNSLEEYTSRPSKAPSLGSGEKKKRERRDAIKLKSRDTEQIDKRPSLEPTSSTSKAGSGSPSSSPPIKWKVSSSSRRLINRPEFTVPKKLERKDIQGKVQIRFKVDPRGVVVFSEILKSSGYPLLDLHVRTFVRRHRFNAVSKDIKSEGIYILIFKN